MQTINLTAEQKNIINRLNIVHDLYNKVGDIAFWAKDVDEIASPAMLAYLRKEGILKNTGVVEEHFILINEFNDTYKKVTVKQWQFCDNFTESRGYLRMQAQARGMHYYFTNMAKEATIIANDIKTYSMMYL